MSPTFSGDYSGNGMRFAIVVARFNDFITSRLLEGARDTLLRHGVKEDALDVVWVPGAVEIPLVAQKLAETKRYQAVLCLGCVIRGATSHYDLVIQSAARGISDATMSTGVPVMFGVLTCETIEQAIERAGTKSGNKGCDVAMAALETANLLKQIGDQTK